MEPERFVIKILVPLTATNLNKQWKGLSVAACAELFLTTNEESKASFGIQNVLNTKN
jgi:hypothetical protein